MNMNYSLPVRQYLRPRKEYTAMYILACLCEFCRLINLFSVSVFFMQGFGVGFFIPVRIM